MDSDFLPFTRPSLGEETVSAVADVLRSGWITTGPKVAELEQALAAYLGGERRVLALSTGTAALEAALAACGIGAGDEVIVPAMTFAATANVVLRAGARPVFADIELETRNLDMSRLEEAITPRTRAVMPVHFAGLPVAMDALYDIARRHRLRVIEDAAHAIGSAWNGRRIGGFGDLVCFSFHANKNMTTIEGGAISVGDPELLPVLERLRFHGISRDEHGQVDVTVAGGKMNLSDVCAAVGLLQLPQLDTFNARRRALATRYLERLAGDVPGVLPARGNEGHSWHMFTLLLPFAELGMARHEFQQAMRRRGIGVGVHYPALPDFTLYRELGHRAEDFPVATRVGRETVTLPLFPGMAEADVDRVCDTLRRVLEEAA
ncbi:MAG TPA: DegT/DnrJ/EryC1/StrS aminotransferase family protein [Gammaproteobacteria bacterium]|nr:DegT/DnrJ/EryC1/StrS aminotransferase family protein [Gammaproteobacteria bacterium]